MLKIINDKTFANLAQGDKPIVLTFFADWCGPCKMQHPILEELAADDELKDIEFVKINIDSSQIASEYNVMSIPQIILLKGNEEVNRVMGFTPAPKLKSIIKATFE